MIFSENNKVILVPKPKQTNSFTALSAEGLVLWRFCLWCSPTVKDVVLGNAGSQTTRMFRYEDVLHDCYHVTVILDFVMWKGFGQGWNTCVNERGSLKRQDCHNRSKNEGKVQRFPPTSPKRLSMWIMNDSQKVVWLLDSTSTRTFLILFLCRHVVMLDKQLRFG